MLLGIQGSGQLTETPPDPGRFRAVAELAEELGYDSIWAGEHLSFHNPILDLGVALAAFAAVTERMRIGAGVVLLPAAASRASWPSRWRRSTTCRAGGSLLGVGVGGEGAKDFEAAGHRPVAERGARADEGIAALRALFSRPGPASFGGRFYRFDGRRDRARSPRAGRAADPGRRPVARLRSAAQEGSGTAGCRISSRRAGSRPAWRSCARTRSRRDAIPRLSTGGARRVRPRRGRRRAGARGRPGAPVAALPDALRGLPRRAPLHRGHT